MRGRGPRLGYEQATCSCDSWAAAVEGNRRAVSRLKLSGVIPLLPFSGLMHLVLRKENNVCLEVVAALGKSGTQGNRRLGKTKTWENVRLRTWKDVTVGPKVCYVYICMLNMTGSKAGWKKTTKKWFPLLCLAYCSGGGITSSCLPLVFL